MNEIEFKSKPSDLLAAVIVTNKTLGSYKQESKWAMEELTRRKANGDQFNYHEYIEKHVNSMPKVDTKKFDLINQFLGSFK